MKHRAAEILERVSWMLLDDWRAYEHGNAESRVEAQGYWRMREYVESLRYQSK